MKKIFSIASLLLITSCGFDPKQVPVDHQYVVDLANKVCVKYQVVDKKNFTFGDGQELPLEPGGPCDRMVGSSLNDFKTLQNWVRDQISKSEKQSIELP
jgi:hypothetical protein